MDRLLTTVVISLVWHLLVRGDKHPAGKLGLKSYAERYPIDPLHLPHDYETLNNKEDMPSLTSRRKTARMLFGSIESRSTNRKMFIEEPKVR